MRLDDARKPGREGGREEGGRERDRETERQTERQRDRETERQTERERDRERERENLLSAWCMLRRSLLTGCETSRSQKRSGIDFTHVASYQASRNYPGVTMHDTCVLRHTPTRLTT